MQRAIFSIRVVYSVQIVTFRSQNKASTTFKKVKIEQGADISGTHLMSEGPCCLSRLSAPVPELSPG